MEKFSLQDKARCGEKHVRILYEKNNYKILKKNYRRIGTEIDLIVLKEKTLVFVEVKLRKNSFIERTRMEDLVSLKKQKALARGAQHFLQEFEKMSYNNIRFDLCLIGYQTKENLIEIKAMNIYKDFLFGVL